MKHPIIITLATSTLLIAGGITLAPERKPIIVDPVPVEKPKRVVLAPQQVAQFFQDCGIQGKDHAKVRDMLLNEAPQTIDLSTTDLKATVEDHIQCLTQEEMVTAYKQGKRSINRQLIEKAENGNGFARDKTKDNFVNDQ